MIEETMPENDAGSATTAIQMPPKSFLNSFFGVITDPAKTFHNIIAVGSWVLILLVIILVAGGIEQVYHSQLIDMTIQKMQAKAGENAQQLDKIIEFYQNAALTRPIYFIITALGQIVVLLIITILCFFICTVMLGGTVKFKQVWVVSCWAYIIMLIGMLVRTPLIVAKNNIQAGLNFGLIFTENMVGTKLHNFFGVIDLFGIWHFIVLGIGLAILYKFAIKKGIGISFVIWLLMTLVMGVMAYFSA
jgi:hypothetical protein